MNNIENIKFFLGDLKASNYNLSFIESVENLIKENKDLKEENQKRMMLELNKEIVIVNNKMYTIDKELYNDLLNDMILKLLDKRC